MKLFHRKGHRVNNRQTATPKPIAERAPLNSYQGRPVLEAHGYAAMSNKFNSAALASCKRPFPAGPHVYSGLFCQRSALQAFAQLASGFLRPWMRWGASFCDGNFAFRFLRHRPALASLPVFTRCGPSVLVCWDSFKRCRHSFAGFWRNYFPHVCCAELGATFCGVGLSLAAGAGIVDRSPLGSERSNNSYLLRATSGAVCNSSDVPKSKRLLPVFEPSVLQVRIGVGPVPEFVSMLTQSLSSIFGMPNVESASYAVSNKVNSRGSRHV